MFKSIVVPLDGSPMSEQALPIAVSIARRTGANLRLVHVRKPAMMPVLNRDLPIPPAPAEKEQDYLNLMAWQIKQGCKIEVQTAVLDGPVAETLAEHARGVHADLMVLTTHGRGPLSRFWMGSVADELVRRGPVPLLIQRPTGEDAPPTSRDLQLENVLITLDGSKLAEAAVAPAVELARAMQAGVTLLRVVEPMPVVATDGMIPQPVVIDAGVIDELKSQARTYLEAIADPLRKSGMRVATRISIDDRIASAVLDEAKAFDLVAIATHGYSKFARAMLGSVADKVVRGSPAPVLVVRPPRP